STRYLHTSRLRRPFLVRHPFLDPRTPPSAQRARLFPTSLPKFSRHTGACGFVWSSTEYGENRSFRDAQLRGGSDRMLGRHSNGARNRLVAVVVGSFSPGVDNNDLAGTRFERTHFSDRNVFRMDWFLSGGHRAALTS